MAQKPKKPTDKQLTFVAEYLKNGHNGSAAYRVAYNAKNMTDKTVREAASRLLRNSNVAAMIESAASKASKRAEVSAARVLEENARIALSDLRQVFDENMNLKAIKDWPDELASAIASVEVTSIGGEEGLKYVTKVRAWPKNAALDMLMKHMGLYEKDNAQKRPYEAMTDEQLANALRESLRIARIPVPGEGSGDQKLPEESGSVH